MNPPQDCPLLRSVSTLCLAVVLHGCGATMSRPATGDQPDAAMDSQSTSSSGGVGASSPATGGSGGLPGATGGKGAAAMTGGRTGASGGASGAPGSGGGPVVNPTGIAALCGVDLEPSVPAGPVQTRTAPSASGVTYVVSSTGTASAPCTSAQPCREIARAVALVHAGDVILIGDGTYQHFGMDDVHGTAQRPIVLFALAHAANVTPGPNTTDGRDSILLNHSSYVVIDGLNAAQAARSGIGVLESAFITVKNGVFANNAKWGAFTGFCDDCAFIHNEFAGSVEQHGLYASNSSDRNLIRANLAHGNNASGIQINADQFTTDQSFYTGKVDGISSNNCVERNVLFDNGSGGGGTLNFDGVQNSLVRNNLIYGNRNTGITNYQTDGAEGPKGMWIINNTVSMPAGGRNALQFLSSSGKNIARNNILLHASASRGGLELLTADALLLDSDFNLMDRVVLDDSIMLVSAFRTLLREAHSVAAGSAAMFVNAAGADYHLSATSPAAHGAGEARAEVPLDMDGIVRAASGGVCIGAFDGP